MRAKKLGLLFFISIAALVFTAAGWGEAPSPGSSLLFEARSRLESPRFSGRWTEATREVEWDARETAIIICDMWDRHWCPSATARVAELAPAINDFVAAARRPGALIVHAPSETMDFYADYPQRQAAQNAVSVHPPAGMAKGKNFISLRELLDKPVDDLDGGCDCKGCKQRRAWSRQIETIAIAPEDVISDSGAELWNVFAARGVRNVLLVGVHTNMCVVSRSFGLRNWVRHGFAAMLVRDLTDAMYNPARPPYVDHFSGTDRVVEHIERYICPTVLSTAITGKPPFRFQDDHRPLAGADTSLYPAQDPLRIIFPDPPGPAHRP